MNGIRHPARGDPPSASGDLPLDGRPFFPYHAAVGEVDVVPREVPANSTGAVPCPECDRVDPGLADCALLRPGVAGGAHCEVYRTISRAANRFIRLRYPERAADAGDVTQEVWLGLLEGCGRRAPGGGRALRSWLRSVVANRATDLFRRERIVARKRCGACAYLGTDEPRRCGKASVRDPATGGDRPNPWFGAAMGSEASPEALDPPCGEFLWRYRPLALEETLPAAAARVPDPATAVEPPGAEILAALARLARRGPEAMRRASVVYRHHVEEEPLEDVARSLGITARTARRDVRRAFLELREILEVG